MVVIRKSRQFASNALTMLYLLKKVAKIA